MDHWKSIYRKKIISRKIYLIKHKEKNHGNQLLPRKISVNF